MAERVNNFPPLPQFMRIKPCFYHNIEEEIPAPHQQLVRRVYTLWMMYSGTLCLNVISCIAWWVGGGNATNFGFSLLWLVLFSPCSYTCWFRPLYKAFRADSSFNFMAFFFIFFLQCALALIQTIGISGWGTCGWIATVIFFSYNTGSAIVMLITALLFTLVTALMALVLIKVSEHTCISVVHEFNPHGRKQTQTLCQHILLPSLSSSYRCTECTVAVEEVWRALRRSGAPGCGRVLQ
uniref:Secretory carrier-associated membrane protein n=1 Tax=Labrus bergylta TaxID=56723 RepID=A0A3Q3EN48_9LABR